MSEWKNQIGPDFKKYCVKITFSIRRKLCIGHRPISGLPCYNPIHYWSKFCKGVKQGIQLACIRCLNAQEICWWRESNASEGSNLALKQRCHQGDTYPPKQRRNKHSGTCCTPSVSPCQIWQLTVPDVSQRARHPSFLTFCNVHLTKVRQQNALSVNVCLIVFSEK